MQHTEFHKPASVPEQDQQGGSSRPHLVELLRGELENDARSWPEAKEVHRAVGYPFALVGVKSKAEHLRGRSDEEAPTAPAHGGNRRNLQRGNHQGRRERESQIPPTDD